MIRAARLVGVALALAAAPAAAQFLKAPADELLDPDKAFRISARALDERTLEVEFKIAPGYYMYRDRFSFATESGKRLADVDIPRGTPKEDQFFGKSETFRDLVKIRVPLSAEDAAAGRVNLKVTSQGCSDSGVCYVPYEQLVRVSLPGGSSAVGAPSGLEALRGAAARVSWAALVASLAAGLALGWAAAGGPLGLRAAVRFARLPGWGSWAWGLTLALAGGAFGWLGAGVEERAENPWLATPLALAYLFCAGTWFYWSQRPRASETARTAQNATLLTAVLLGAAYAGDAALGAAATLGAGLAAGSLPKRGAGAIHEFALQCVALAMLAAAAWVAGPLMAGGARMLAWAAWLFVAAGLLRAVDPLPEQAPAVLRLAKVAGIVALVWAVAVLIGAASGGRDPLQPFAAWRAAQTTAVTGTGK